MLCFAIARYPLQIAIFLGILGGLAGGVLSKWWKLEKELEAPELKDNGVAVPKALERLSKQVKRFGLQNKEDQKRKRKQPRIGLFGGVRPRR
ncbi:MAG: hypothetical protein AAGD25_00395 [Cyanobacteria bacterium P01_F01_bin.150]